MFATSAMFGVLPDDYILRIIGDFAGSVGTVDPLGCN